MIKTENSFEICKKNDTVNIVHFHKYIILQNSKRESVSERMRAELVDLIQLNWLQKKIHSIYYIHTFACAHANTYKPQGNMNVNQVSGQSKNWSANM